MKTLKKYEDFPVIYLRYLNDKLMYIGESCSYHRNRHGRQGTLGDNPGDYDKIIILKAVKNTKRRKYWEALLITKMKPTRQDTKFYEYKVKKENGKDPKMIRSHSVSIDKATKKEILYAAYTRLNQFKELMESYKL